MNDEIKRIQNLLDKYMDGATSNGEEATLRKYFEEHANDIPEEWESYRALFSYIGFEQMNLSQILKEEKEKEIEKEDILEDEEKNIPKKELDLESTNSQKHLLWWKDNISKMDDVARVEERWKEFDKKWGGIKFADMTDIQCKERKSEHKLIKSEENKLDIGRLNIHLLMEVRQEIPKSWM